MGGGPDPKPPPTPSRLSGLSASADVVPSLSALTISISSVGHIPSATPARIGTYPSASWRLTSGINPAPAPANVSDTEKKDEDKEKEHLLILLPFPEPREVVDRLRSKHPGLRVTFRQVGFHQGWPGDSDDLKGKIPVLRIEEC